MSTNGDDAILEQLISIKKLLVFALLRNGATQSQIAAALGTSQSTISKMFPNGAGAASQPKGRQ
jgi:hypothetical protein